MADITHNTIINSNLVEVFKAVTDYGDSDAIKRWQTATRSVGVTAGDPLRTGSMIAMKRRFIMSEIFVNLDVIDLQRNKRFDLKGMHGRFPIQREIEFVPDGRQTQVIDRIWIKTGWLYFWWRPVVVSSLQSQTAAEWQRLRQQLES
ncbi:MAG: hypothetical protein ACFE0Q_08800 [Anaerolineae bacterium]